MDLLRPLAGSVAAAAMLAGLSSPASALSCVQATLEDSFNGWVESSETYYIGSGELTPVGPVPDVPSPGAGSFGIEAPELRAVYRFRGNLIAAQGLTPIDHLIWVSVGCAGPWCGAFPQSGTQGLIALRHLPDYRLEYATGPCPGSSFPDGDGSATRRVQACLAAGRCPEAVPVAQ